MGTVSLPLFGAFPWNLSAARGLRLNLFGKSHIVGWKSYVKACLSSSSKYSFCLSTLPKNLNYQIKSRYFSMLGRCLIFMLSITIEMKWYMIGGTRALGPAVIPRSHRWSLPEQPRMENGPRAFAILLIAFILLMQKKLIQSFSKYLPPTCQVFF